MYRALSGLRIMRNINFCSLPEIIELCIPSGHLELDAGQGLVTGLQGREYANGSQPKAVHFIGVQMDTELRRKELWRHDIYEGYTIVIVGN